MIDITIEIDGETGVNIKTWNFEMAKNFLLRYAQEDSKIYFKVLSTKEESFNILNNWQKEFSK